MRCFFSIVLMSLSLSVYAHGDEEHAGAAPVPSQSVAPRALASTEEFEMVAVLDAKKMSIYLDRFASNEPVLKAKVEVEGAGVKAYAKETSPGVYEIELPLLKPGKYPLTMTLEAGDVNDLLSTSLDIESPAVSAQHNGKLPLLSLWSVATVLVLALSVFIYLVIRRHRKIQKA